MAAVELPPETFYNKNRTIGRLDFVILQKGFRNKYRKFELHAVADGRFMGICWRSAAGSEWEPDFTTVGERIEVILKLNKEIDKYLRRGWLVAYYGTGTLLTRR